MKQQKTVESRVLEILKECPMSRYDDMLLILHYYNRYGYIPAGNLPLEDIVFNYRAYGLPCFETIRRARQRVQSLFPEYSRNPQKEEQSGSISIVINISYDYDMPLFNKEFSRTEFDRKVRENPMNEHLIVKEEPAEERNETEEVQTNMGSMPIEDYREIVASQSGFDSANILARMGKNQYVSMETVEKICKKMDCTIDEMMEFTD